MIYPKKQTAGNASGFPVATSAQTAFEEWLKKQEEENEGSSQSGTVSAQTAFEEWQKNQIGKSVEELWKDSGIESMNRDFYGYAERIQNGMLNGTVDYANFAESSANWRENIQQERNWLDYYGAALGDNAALIGGALDEYERLLNYYDSLYRTRAAYDQGALVQGSELAAGNAGWIMRTADYATAYNNTVGQVQALSAGNLNAQDRELLGLQLESLERQGNRALEWLANNRKQLTESGEFAELSNYYGTILQGVAQAQNLLSWYKGENLESIEDPQVQSAFEELAEKQRWLEAYDSNYNQFFGSMMKPSGSGKDNSFDVPMQGMAYTAIGYNDSYREYAALTNEMMQFQHGEAMSTQEQNEYRERARRLEADAEYSLQWLEANRMRMSQAEYDELKGYYSAQLLQADLLQETINYYAEDMSAAEVASIYANVYAKTEEFAQNFAAGTAPVAELTAAAEQAQAKLDEIDEQLEDLADEIEDASGAEKETLLAQQAQLQQERSALQVQMTTDEEALKVYWGLALTGINNDEAKEIIEIGKEKYERIYGLWEQAVNNSPEAVGYEKKYLTFENEKEYENAVENYLVNGVKLHDKKVLPNGRIQATIYIENYTQDLTPARARERENFPLAIDTAHLTEEEKNTFYYLVGAGYDSMAIDYAQSMAIERRNERMQEIEEWAGQNLGTQILALIQQSIMFPMAGRDILTASSNAQDTGLNADPNLGVGAIKDALNSGVTKAWDQWSGTVPNSVPVLGGKGLGSVYQMGVSMGESYGSAAAMGPYSIIFMGLAAGSSGYNEAIMNGATPEQALAQGAAQGAAEAIFEKVSVGHWLDGKDYGSIIKNALVQGGIEASEEQLTSIVNEITDRLIMQDKSNFNRSVQEYMRNGYSESEAKEKAWLEVLYGVVYDTFSGFITGGVMGGASSFMEYRASGKEAKQYVALENSEKPEDLLNYYVAEQAAGVLESDSAEQKEAKIAAWLRSGGTYTAEQQQQALTMAMEQLSKTAEQKAQQEAQADSGTQVMQEQPVQEAGAAVQAERTAQNPYYRTETGQRYEIDAEEVLTGIRIAAAERFADLGRSDSEAIGQMLAQAVQAGSISSSAIDKLQPTIRENLDAISAALGVEIQYTANKAAARKNVQAAVQAAAENYQAAQNPNITVSERYMEGVRELSDERLAELIDENTAIRDDTGAVAASRQQAQDILDALYAEQERRYGGKIDEEAAGTQVRHAEPQRNDRVGAGKQGGSVQERNAAQVEQGRQGANDQGDRQQGVRKKRDLSRSENIAKTKSTRDYLGKAGAEEVTLGEVTEEYWTDEMRQAAEKAEAAGLTVHYVVGSILRANGDRGGGGVYYRGTILASVNDVRFLPEQLVEHEMYHADATQEATEEILAAIRERYTAEEFERIVREYADEYEGIIAEDDVQALYEEIAADAAGGMNRFADTGKVAASREQAQEIISRKGREAQRGDRAREPPAEAKYSTEADDAAYMEAVEAGDFAELQRMVNAAAKAAMPDSKAVDADGNLLPMFHGTSYGGFTVFDTYGSNFGLFGQGSYFTADPGVAMSYTAKGQGDRKQLYQVFINATKPIDMDAVANMAQWQAAFENEGLDLSYLDEAASNEDAFRAMQEALAAEGFYRAEAYDVIANALSGMGYDSITHVGGGRHGAGDGTRHRVFIAWDPEQVKSAEPVTYDDEGNVIPLSERFDPEQADIRWSAGSKEELEQRQAELEQRKEDLREEYNLVQQLIQAVPTLRRLDIRNAQHRKSLVSVLKILPDSLREYIAWDGVTSVEYAPPMSVQREYIRNQTEVSGKVRSAELTEEQRILGASFFQMRRFPHRYGQVNDPDILVKLNQYRPDDHRLGFRGAIPMGDGTYVSFYDGHHKENGYDKSDDVYMTRVDGDGNPIVVPKYTGYKQTYFVAQQLQKKGENFLEYEVVQRALRDAVDQYKADNAMLWLDERRNGKNVEQDVLQILEQYHRKPRAGEALMSEIKAVKEESKQISSQLAEQNSGATAEKTTAMTEAQRQAEALARAAEEARVAEQERLAEEARKAEAERKAAEEARAAEEAARQAVMEAELAEAEARLAEEQARRAEEQARQAEAAKKAEQQRRAEQARLAAEEAARAAEEARLAEQERLAAEAKAAEEAARAAEEARKAEAAAAAAAERARAAEARKAEQQERAAQRAERKRQAKEDRQSARQAEREARIAERQRKAEAAMAKRAEEARLAEEARKAEAERKAAEAARKAEQQNRAEQARLAAEEAARAAENRKTEELQPTEVPEEPVIQPEQEVSAEPVMVAGAQKEPGNVPEQEAQAEEAEVPAEEAGRADELFNVAFPDDGMSRKVPQEDTDPRRPWEIVSDHTHSSAQEMGYPVLEGEQVIPFKTWVKATDLRTDGKPWNNYGLVIANSVTTRQLGVSFWSKDESAGIRKGAYTEFKWIDYKYLHPVQGEYQMTKAEYDSLMASVPEEVAREQIDFMGDNAAEFSKLYEEILWQREQQRLRDEENGLKLDEAPEGFPWNYKKPLRSTETRLSPRDAARYLEAATGKEWLITRTKGGSEWKAMPGKRNAEHVKDEAYEAAKAEAERRGETFKSLKQYAWEKLQEAMLMPGERVSSVHPEGIDRDEFEGTEAINKLGIRISGSVVDYADTETIKEREMALRKSYLNIQKMERALTKNEGKAGLGSETIKYAKLIAEGDLLMEDIPKRLNRRDVIKLAEMMLDHKMIGEDLSNKRKLAINRELQAEALARLPDQEGVDAGTEQLKRLKLAVMNYRTPERNLRAMFGDKRGAELFDYYFRTVRENEAERKRWIQEQFDGAREFVGQDGESKGLNKQESAYVHAMLDMQGYSQLIERSRNATQIKELSKVWEEAKKKDPKADLGARAAAMEQLRNGAEKQVVELSEQEKTLTETLTYTEVEWAQKWAEWRAMQADRKTMAKIDKVRCDNAVMHFRAVFDAYYKAMVDFMVAHGLTPLGHIDYYAPHLTINDRSEIMAGFFNVLGLKSEKFGNISELPADIAGKTQDFRPTRKWNPFALKRTGTKTDYNIVKAFEKYVTHVAEVFYHHDDLLKLRALEAATRNTANRDWQKEMRKLIMAARSGDLQEKQRVLRKLGVKMPEDMDPVEMFRQLSREADVEQKHNWLIKLGEVTKEEVLTEEQVHALFDELGSRSEKAFITKADQLFREYGLGKESNSVTLAEAEDKLNRIFEHLLQSDNAATQYTNFVQWLNNYNNLLAGKQYGGDRGMEYSGGRKLLDLVNNTSRRFSGAKVIGNMGSVIAQTAQMPAIIKSRSAAAQAKAFRDIMASVSSKFERGRELREWKIYSDILTGKRGVEYIDEKFWEKVIGYATKPMEWVDSFVTTFAARSAYYDAIDGKVGGIAKGNQKAANRYADDFATQIMGSRDKGSRPNAFSSKLLTMVNVFQVEALNLMDHFASDMPAQWRADARKYGKAKASAKLAWSMFVYFAAAFLLNRGEDELYGQTPAAFSVADYILQFIAAGYGVTTNELIFGGGNKKEEFQWGDAWSELGQEVAGDIPLASNIAALFGYGDQKMPLPDVSKIWDGAKKAFLAMTDQGVSGKEAMKAIGKALAEVMPLGNQINKTIQGIIALIDSGVYNDDGALQWAVDNDAWNIIQNVIFGVNATQEAKAYYAGGYGALNAQLTDAYEEFVEDGMEPDDAYDLVYELRKIDRQNADLTAAEVNALQRAWINQADISDEDKLYLFTQTFGSKDPDTGMIEHKAAEAFALLMDAGMSWAEIQVMYEKHEELENVEEMESHQKNLDFNYWVRQQNYNAEQEELILKNFGQVERFVKLADSGIGDDAAKELEEQIQAYADSLPEDESLQSVDKIRIIMDYGLSDSDCYKALRTVLGDGTFDKLSYARDNGISCQDYMNFYLATKDLESDRDEEGKPVKGQEKKDKVLAYIDSLPISREEKDILFLTEYKESGLPEAPWN